MFTHCVLFKKEPFYVLADNEERVKKIAQDRHEDVIGVIQGKDIIVLTVKNSIALEHTELLQVENKKETIEEDIRLDVCEDLIEEVCSETQATLGLS